MLTATPGFMKIKPKERLRLPIVLAGAVLMALGGSPSWKAQGQEPIGTTIYQPSQIDCSNPPADILAIQVPAGLLRLDEYCQVQGPVQQQQRSDAILWGPVYQIGNSICRDRAGVNTVCVTPEAAARLRWSMPF
jgi:hypothetical protein